MARATVEMRFAYDRWRAAHSINARGLKHLCAPIHSNNYSRVRSARDVCETTPDKHLLPGLTVWSRAIATFTIGEHIAGKTYGFSAPRFAIRTGDLVNYLRA